MLVNPFSLTVMLEKDEKPILFDAEVSAKCVSYKNKAGKDIGVTIDFDYKSITKSEDVCAYVTKIEEKNKLPEKNYSIKICKPEKGLSVFEIAKSLEISPDVLLAQNPGLEDGTLDKIVVYLKSNK